MKKLILFTVAIVTIIILIAIGILFIDNPDRIFKIHILPQTSKTIADLKYYKDRCAMHGPFIFAFKATPKDIQEIIQNNNLAKYEKIPEFVNTLFVHMDGHNLIWWKKADDLSLMNIYGKVKQGSSEPHCKFIFIDKETFVYYLQI